MVHVSRPVRSSATRATEAAVERPEISVIIPTYNSSRTLRAAVASVLLQSHVDFEVLVVGDGCTDDSADAMAAVGDERVTWIGLDSNSGGPSVPRNVGLDAARGRWVAYLGHDDLWFPWHLEGALETAAATGADLVSTVGAFLEPGGTSTAFGLPARPRTAAPLCPSSWLHRRDLGLRWPTHLRWADEVWFVDRLRRIGGSTGQGRELSAIKLPAPSWVAYGDDPGDVQDRLLAQMRSDARGLQRSLLADMAATVAEALVLSGRSRWPLSVRAAFAVAVGVWRPYRWPLDRLIRARQRRLSGLAARRRDRRSVTG